MTVVTAPTINSGSVIVEIKKKMSGNSELINKIQLLFSSKKKLHLHNSSPDKSQIKAVESPTHER